MAIFQGSFELYLVAIIFFGAYTISGQTYRFAAADVADEKWHGIAISLVIGGGVLAAFIGPEISKWTHDVASLWLGNETFAKVIEFICGPGITAAATVVPGENPPYQFGVTFIVLAFLPIFLIFMVSLVGFPKNRVCSNTFFESSIFPTPPEAITGIFTLEDISFNSAKFFSFSLWLPCLAGIIAYIFMLLIPLFITLLSSMRSYH